MALEPMGVPKAERAARVTEALTHVGLAIAGGLIAGAFGGWRAARLSPAEALRSVG